MARRRRTFECCNLCGDVRARATELSDYHYTQSGLKNVWLKGGVRRIECDNCKKSYTTIWNEWQLLQVIALKVLTKPAPLTGAEQRYLRRTCKMTQEELAVRLGLSRSETVSDRERDQEGVLSPADDFLLRAVILTGFKKLISDPEENFLNYGHAQLLHELETAFFDLSLPGGR